MIRARAAYNLETLSQAVIASREEIKLAHYEGELLKALRRVRDERFKLKQASFQQLRTGRQQGE